MTKSQRKNDLPDVRIEPATVRFPGVHASDRATDTKAPFWGLNLSISNSTVSTKIYDKRDDFDFDIIDFPFLDGDVPRCTSYGV